MALYRIGTAAMDAQGVITGTGTKWREPLSLIRTGATIVFLEQPVIQLAVISEIVSDTEMKAISTDGAVVSDGKYVILLNDSLTVDGMAQDVAETLRYYQSKETVIEEAIEFFKNFDLKTLQDLVNKVNADAQQVAIDKAATEQLKNDTQQIKADTDAIKTQTQQIKDSAVTEIGEIRNDALNARDEAEEAQFAAEQSNVAAGNAKQGAETARDEARQWAQQVNPENLLHKDQNLNDIPDKDGARNNLGLGKNHSPIFAGIDLEGRNSTTSGIATLRNRSADGTQVSYSRVYNEIQNGVVKTTIQTTKEGGSTSYLQIDETGNIANANSIKVGGGGNSALGVASIAVGDADTGIKWGGDGILQAVADNTVMFAFTKTGNISYRTIQSYSPDDTSFAYVEGTRIGGANCFIGGKVEGGVWTKWRDRASGMLVEHSATDAAVNIFKAVKFGTDWVCALDSVIYEDGSTEARLHVRGADYSFNDVGYASCVQWVSTSDIRLKANLKEIESAKEKVKSIKGYTYFKRNNIDEDEYSFYSEEAGVIAQDVQTVLPEAVYKISDSEILGVSYGGVTALLVNAINEMIDDSDKQNELIASQQEEINTLRNELDELKKLVNSMIN